MAVIKTFRTALLNAAVIEDPIPGSPYIFFQLDAYNKTTLAPQFDTQINFSSTGALVLGLSGTAMSADTLNGAVNQFGVPIIGGTPITWTTPTWYTGVLVLNGEVTHCRHMQFNTVNRQENNIDPTVYLSMDPTRVPKPASYWTDGPNNSAVWVHHLRNGGGTGAGASSVYNDTIYAVKVNSTSADLVNGGFMNTKSRGSNGVSAGLIPTNSVEFSYPLYRNPSTGNLIWHGLVSQYGSPTVSYYPSSFVGCHRGGAFTPMASTSTTAPTAGVVINSTNQFVGASLIDGLSITFSNSTTDDITQRFYKYNDASNTFTTLNTITATPGASGSSVGGNRTTTFGSYKAKFSSRWFTDPLASNSRGFFVPYVDTAGNYAPFYYQWNTSTDSFSRNSNVTINWGGGNTQSTFWTHDTTLASGQSLDYGMQSVWYNETFTVGANRYLLFMQLNGAGGLLDANPNACTFLCFSVSGADPRNLTYHSRIRVPVTPKNIIWLDDSRTTIGVFTHNNFYIYTFSEANGWAQTAILPFQFSAVGRDNLGRIWAVDPGPYQWGRVHLITLTVPVNIVVTPDATAYTYSGSTINANVAVKALDANGNRISTNVKLVIDGGSMLFGGNNYTTTVTTSASADVNVAVSITGGGVSNIIASVPV